MPEQTDSDRLGAFVREHCEAAFMAWSAPPPAWTHTRWGGPLWWLYLRWTWYAPIPLRNLIRRIRGKRLI